VAVIIGGDDGVGSNGHSGVAVDVSRGIEDLVRQVRIQRAGDVGEDGEVPVDELHQLLLGIHGSRAASATDEERPFGEAEVELIVDDEKVDALLVATRGLDAVLHLVLVRSGVKSVRARAHVGVVVTLLWFVVIGNW
jgi:hypothetical protein